MNKPDDIGISALGIVAGFGGSAITLLDHIEQWIRVGTGLIGLIIAILTLVMLLEKRSKKKKSNDN